MRFAIKSKLNALSSAVEGSVNINLSRRAFFDEVVSRWGRSSLSHQRSKTEFLRNVVGHAQALSASDRLADSSFGLDLFRASIIRDEQIFRSRLDARQMQIRRSLSHEQAAWLRVLEITPDLLTPMGELRFEPIHTKLLAYFISLRRRSAIGPAPLVGLLQLLNDEDEHGLANTVDSIEKVLVTSEKYFNPRCRVDIFIELPDEIVAIEVKVDAGERPKQLRDYEEAMRERSNGKRHKLVLLSLEKPAEKSSDDAIDVTFKALLRQWMPIAVSGTTDEHQFFQRYLKSLARLYKASANGPFEHWDFASRRNALGLIMGEDDED